jgi:hypothetical protein
MSSATIQFQPIKGMGIETEPDRSVGETGCESADKTLSPFLFVVLAAGRGRAVVVAQEEVAAEPLASSRKPLAQAELARPPNSRASVIRDGGKPFMCQ